MQPSLKQRSHSLGYILNSPVSVPFCPECHSYPCACDDNILTHLLNATGVYNAVEDNWPRLKYAENKRNDA
jgi:hypothetical protein